MARGWLTSLRDGLARRPGDAKDAAYVSFHAEINQTTSEALLSVIARQLQEGRRDIHLMLSTPGGGVANGLMA